MPRTKYLATPVTLAPNDTAAVTFDLDVVNDTARSIVEDSGQTVTVYGLEYRLILEPSEEWERDGRV